MAFDTQLATGQSKDVFLRELEAVKPTQLYGSEFELPKSFDGRQAWQKYLPPLADQGKCGSCYSYAWAAVLGTRFGLLSGGRLVPQLTAVDAVICPLLQPGEDLVLSHYTALKDASTKEREVHEQHMREELKAHEIRACHGDSLLNTAKFLFLVGATTTSCVPNSLLAAGSHLPTCEEVEDPTHTLSFNGCYKSNVAQRTFRLQSVYRLDISDPRNRDRQIMYELAKFGPVVAAMYIFEDFYEFEPSVEIYTHPKHGSSLGGHAVAIVGWGEEQQGGRSIPYWLVRNSWGVSWGDDGYFKIGRWLPECQLEDNIIAGTPELFNTQRLQLPTLPAKFVQAREGFEVNLRTYYALETEKLIRAGTLKGDLKPIVKPGSMPDLGVSFSVLHPSAHPAKTIGRGDQSESKARVWLLWIALLIGLLLLGIAAAHWLRR